MTNFNIDGLPEEELIELNHKIVSRLRILRQMRSHVAMLEFRIGEKVRFSPAGQDDVVGTLTRYNKKTVTVIAENGEHWNVSPAFLAKVDSSGAKPTGSVASSKGPVVVFQPRESKTSK